MKKVRVSLTPGLLGTFSELGKLGVRHIPLLQKYHVYLPLHVFFSKQWSVRRVLTTSPLRSRPIMYAASEIAFYSLFPNEAKSYLILSGKYLKACTQQARSLF
jgi:hypothetical protein